MHSKTKEHPVFQLYFKPLRIKTMTESVTPIVAEASPNFHTRMQSRTYSIFPSCYSQAGADLRGDIFKAVM